MKVLYVIKGKKLLYPAADAVAVAGAYILSALLVPQGAKQDMHAGLYRAAAAALIYAGTGYLFQVYRIVWGHSNFRDMRFLAAAHVAAVALFAAAHPLLGSSPGPAGLLLFFLTALTVCTAYRMVLRDALRGRVAYGGSDDASRKNVLIVGAGEAGGIILSEYQRMGLGNTIAGFIDDDPSKRGRLLNGKPIFGPVDDIAEVIASRAVTHIILAIPSAGSESISRIVDRIRRADRAVPIRALPHLVELLDRRPLTLTLRDIGLADLIGREEVRADGDTIHREFEGKTVLVTGAGGSIGSELCRQLISFGVKKIVAAGRGENSIYVLARQLNDFTACLDAKPAVSYVIADACDPVRMESVFAEHSPDIVFHAAAHKHVPLMEFNEAEALRNNVGSTMNLLERACRHSISAFVFISTDKAVNPSSVMGATKRIAEMVVDRCHRTTGLRTAVVRFGNVIGSRGSVIPLFMEQIERGGPVTVTHPDVTRYFMSIPEAALLVINAAAYSRGGELFALDMGRQYRVADIAARLIGLYGYRSDSEIKIEYTGLRPGEKLSEDLFYDREGLVRTPHEKIFAVGGAPGSDPAALEAFLRDGLPAVSTLDGAAARKLIKKLVPEYEYSPPPAGDNRKLIN